jgi:hypothetical protein
MEHWKGMEQQQLSLENLRFTLPVELTLKLWRLILDLWILIHKLLFLILECHSGALESDHETSIALPKDVELWRLTLEP